MCVDIGLIPLGRYLRGNIRLEPGAFLFNF